MNGVQGRYKRVYTALISPLRPALEPLAGTCRSADTFAHKLFL